MLDDFLVFKAGPRACFPHTASKDFVFHEGFHGPCSEPANEALICKENARKFKHKQESRQNNAPGNFGASVTRNRLASCKNPSEELLIKGKPSQTRLSGPRY
jgi:hypothetical protein